MEIYSKRIDHTKNSSLAVLRFGNEKRFGFIIEDEPRAKKIVGETRIPAGRYKLSILREDTPLTVKHRGSKYYRGWFRYHIQIENVPNFTGIYFHIGNNEKHTAGCQIGAKNVSIRNGEYVCTNSTEMIREFYERVYPLLERGEDVYYTIIDE